ncbi:hypothetical protein ULMS_19200 [Patiriisocius marinistellae]|uniref:Uncharacterized protein n=1 Tax=Patiriisocius marinistellae TaxID=2494560 RepID=A0A5J4FYW7_9FLAO|nr:hypothetical protein [Patiriisocius marinistellae]GEQ86412.1 hypothetical protein ULMS_19200 [Patiriisocius marinistellae]
MKNIITILALMVSITTLSQNTFLQNGTNNSEENAKDLTEKYNEALIMDTNQRLLFEKKVEEFIISADKIKANYNGKEKLDMLFALRQNEIAEMGDILTRLQLKKYKEVRQQIQPLARVEQ